MHSIRINIIALQQSEKNQALKHSVRSCLMAWSAFTIMLLFNSCIDSDELPVEPPVKQAINWSLASSKALVDDDLLRSSCTPSVYGTHQSIGVWGKYTNIENGVSNTHTIFNATPLTYAPKTEHTNPYNDWNYPGESRYWIPQSQYDFRACYPQALMTSLMTEIDPTIIQGGPINTLTLQEDMLVAAASINIENEMPSGPIALNMKHIFAALKFKVKATDGYTPSSGEGITSCWLQNKGTASNLFSASGYLVHSGNDNPQITWYPYESSSAPMYKWSHKGLSISTENTLYTAEGAISGIEYTDNEGWLLVVPQQVQQGTLQFCYTINSAGNHVFSVDIPAIRYEDGKRYTYVLEIGGANASVSLTIADWNSLDAVYDIVM